MLEAQLQSNYVGAWVEWTISVILVERRARNHYPPIEDKTKPAGRKNCLHRHGELLDSEERALRQRIRAKTTKNSKLRQASRRSQSANKRPAAAEAENKRGARNTGWDRLNQCDSRFRNSTAVSQKLLTVWGFPPPLIVYLRSLATVVMGSRSVMVIKSVGGR